MRSRSVIPALAARPFSSSLRNNRRPWICPPMHFKAAAASTPSGAPPVPIYMSIPVWIGCAQCITPATSPSVIRRIAAPVARISAIICSWRGRSSTQTVISLGPHPLALANASTRSFGVMSSVTTVSANPGPMASLSMYTSGACSMDPRGPMAITVSAFGMSLAVSVVPSSGSSAMSTPGPLPVPTSSPMNSIGASSRSPSPITTTPEISSRFNCSRIAFTAAWSAAFSSPRPIRSTVAIAACSATRARPRDSMRSLKSVGAVMGVSSHGFFTLLSCYAPAPPLTRLVALKPSDLFDPQRHRFAFDNAGADHRGKCIVQRRARCLVRDDQHRGRVLFVAALPHPVDGHTRLAQNRGDLGQGTGLVLKAKPQVIGRRCRGLGGFRLLEVARGLAKGRHPCPACDIQDIAHHRAGCRPFARARTAHDDLADLIAFDDHHVGAPVQLSQRRACRDKTRRHALFQPATGHLAHTQKLDLVTHVGGLLNILDAHQTDAFELDSVKVHLGSECDGRKQRQFMPRIDPTHVQFRIGFEKAKTVGLREGLFVGQVGRFHPCQDIIAGAVHHPHDSLDIIARKPFCQGFDNGNTARHSRFEPQDHAVLLGRFGQRLAMVRQQGLVRRHHVLAAAQCRLGRSLGRAIAAADQFDEHVDIVPLREGDGIVFPLITVHRNTAVLAPVAGAYGRDRDRTPAARFEQRRFLANDLDNARADSAQTRNSKAQWFSHVGQSFCSRSMLMPAIATCAQACNGPDQGGATPPFIRSRVSGSITGPRSPPTRARNASARARKASSSESVRLGGA